VGAHDDVVDALTQLVIRCGQPEYDDWIVW
jgi:hypothetical protein